MSIFIILNMMNLKSMKKLVEEGISGFRWFFQVTLEDILVVLSVCISCDGQVFGCMKFPTTGQAFGHVKFSTKGFDWVPGDWRQSWLLQNFLLLDRLFFGVIKHVEFRYFYTFYIKNYIINT
ncbi:hypothetical protein RhiirC2_806500 [Rhizophagus irregularis]|uniref:Uncharacterized protein n=1 Tax=Rhizophagus irregularis TaxID=588596 RepID=A0A2N1MYY5_9GLOM|nr:hypothetical protein RhiirC2_806500 [Rhizophagus irregularis]